MKGFKFRLYSVWNLRKAELSQALRLYIGITKKIEDYCKLINSLEEKEKKIFKVYQKSREGLFLGSVQDQYTYALEENSKNLLHLNKLLSETRKEHVNQYKILLNAKIKEKMMEALYDKKFSEYNDVFQKKENNNIEDIVCLRFVNK